MSLTRRRLRVRATAAVRITNYPSLPEFPIPYPSGYPQKSPQSFAKAAQTRARTWRRNCPSGTTRQPAAYRCNVGRTCAKSAVRSQGHAPELAPARNPSRRCCVKSAISVKRARDQPQPVNPRHIVHTTGNRRPCEPSDRIDACTGTPAGFNCTFERVHRVVALRAA
jgi:hypothetical protein